MRLLMIAALGCVLATGLIACGGNHSATSVTPASAAGPHQSSGQGRTPRSGCTPDSYGYCIVHLAGSHGAKVDCYWDDGFDHWYYSTVTSPNELYHNNVDQGTYTLTTTNTNCPVETSQSWSPGDPAVVTGDPNLP